ncbi:iron complex transport system permease protein [Seinonella peptonophila]|uniref:Iron complex transport system permease protein n=1 Tax=Seinonella peptonophila TaxID=112248 RepID=A0A1M4X729_9BACL|nr:iron ABC transporter permease [Seinonella peptonophila]SHE89251.1 iron complex transport system permease protein [Seinonella peptonophila]
MSERWQGKRWWLLGCGMFLLILIFFISVGTGNASISPIQVIRTLFGNGSAADQFILYDLRLPRILVVILAGASLAISGGILQSITRNPLADPGILGINSGAALMVVLILVVSNTQPLAFAYYLPIVALIGGLGSAFLIYLLAVKAGEGVSPLKMVLIGIGIASAGSGGSYIFASTLHRNQYDFFAKWMAGNIWGDDWPFVWALLPWVLILIPATLWRANKMNILQLHEQVSIGLGLAVERERRILTLFAAALASAAISVTGVISFLGLIAPHIARRLAGPRHQSFLPLTAILGSSILLLADTIGRVAVEPDGIPTGIVLALIGAPYFMYLLRKN